MKYDGVIIVLVLLIVVSFSFALYFTWKPETCESYSCFQDHMVECSRATYVNEEPEASWRYTVLRRTRESCVIDVILLQAKEGDLKLRESEGAHMECAYPSGVVAYPDKDLSVCHGILKENLQNIIIERLHSYLLENLGEIKDEFRNVTMSQG